MGDGIMALFGAPLAHEDHAARACYAALRMQELVKGYAEGVRRDEGIPIQIRVGVNSPRGEAGIGSRRSAARSAGPVGRGRRKRAAAGRAAELGLKTRAPESAHALTKTAQSRA